MGATLLFGLLGRVLYANPSRNWLNPLLDDDLFDSVPFAGDQSDTTQGLVTLAKWTSAVGGSLTDEALTDLRADYAQLFIGNTRMHVPPWESVYFSEKRLTFQAETLDVRKAYERLSLQINTDAQEPYDHIAFELSFVAHCAELAYHASEEQQDTEFAELIAIQREFLQNHLLRWGCKWADLAYENARTDFYRGLALIVRGGLKELSQVFEVEIPHKMFFPGLMPR